jgi:RHS repeat-associated protein
MDRATNEGTATFTVTRDAADPTLSLSAVSEGADIALDWSASDAGSGLATCALEVREDAGAWQPYSLTCSGTGAYAAQPGHTYTFRLTATDNVGNVGQGEASAIVTAVTKYYYFGSKRVAMRGPDDALVWLHGDHLGSTSLATSAAGEALSRQLYYPFGEQRWASAGLPTDFQFTGQRIQSKIALYDYHARFYDPYLNRFIQADSIVPSPGNPQHFNRYSYVLNNPLRYIDPSGHFSEDEIIDAFGMSAWEDVLALFEEGGELEGLWGWLAVLREAELGMDVSFWAQYGERLFTGTFIEMAGQIYLKGYEIVEGIHPEWGCHQVSTFKQMLDLRFRKMLSWGNSSLFQTRSPMVKIDLNTKSYMGEEYFDPYRKYKRTTININLGNIDRIAAGLDGSGVIADLLGLVNPAAIAVGVAVDIVDLARTTKMFLNGDADLGDVLIDTAGVIPGYGLAADVIDITRNFSSAIEVQDLGP